MTCTHTAYSGAHVHVHVTCTCKCLTKGDYEDPYKPAARSSLELTIMPAVGASSAFSIVSSHSVNVSALAGAFSSRGLPLITAR